MRILHILYQSLPNLQGTSIRSRDLLKSQSAIGLEPIALTSPFQEPADPQKGRSTELIDGIEYHRFYNEKSGQIATDKGSNFFNRLNKFLQVFAFIRKAKELAADRHSEIIHAHATFFTGFAGKYAARKNKVPFIYEIRSIWEEGANTYKKGMFFRLQKKLIRLLENHICRSADIVIVINEGLKVQLINRKLEPGKIRIIPNAFYFEPGFSPVSSFSEQNTTDIRFGFIGNINYYEGLQMLVAAFEVLKKKGFTNKLVVYGNGADLDSFEQLLGSSNAFIEYRGIFPPEHRHLAYQEVDVIINPRLSSFLTEQVTPLKPVEAMGFKKLVIVSDIGGMKELVSHGETGLLFKNGGIEDLLNTILYVLDKKNGKTLRQIIEKGYDYVITNRNWINNARLYNEIYEEALLVKYG